MIVVARFETRHFVFEGVGSTATDAERALRRGWARHCELTDADPLYLAEYIEDVVLHTYQVGECQRDGMVLTDQNGASL